MTHAGALYIKEDMAAPARPPLRELLGGYFWRLAEHDVKRNELHLPTPPPVRLSGMMLALTQERRPTMIMVVWASEPNNSYGYTSKTPLGR